MKTAIKNSKPKKAKELIEMALLDTAFFPKGRKYPTFDLALYSQKDCYPGDQDKESIGGFWIDGWTDALTRPLNFAILMPPDFGSDPNEHWDSAYGQSLRAIPKYKMRGKAARFHAWENQTIGRRRSLGDFQKFAQPYIRGIDFSGEFFRYCCYGDGNYMAENGVYYHDLVVTPRQVLAIGTTGVVLDIRKGAGGKAEEAVRQEVSMMCGLQFNSEYLWRIVIQFEDGRPSISFSASKSIVQSLLKLRTESDKEKKRRMIHIVSSHVRENREGAANNVMRHYRGGVEALWQGCQMQIIPPVNETDSMEKFTNKIKEVLEKTAKIQPATIA